ncbi:Arm DNA-binding domain-containing protein [Erwinia tracheiphila]|nr:Arm DNA-binding domain-containing protein [Erwinia tracheiphila]EOS94609.1 integrase [Erwinia tracheiphila PSU-1]UIA88219.1 Arm DNA-binding domain-containing protein [Erwinia tracheiphila]UIA96360.1 Arm DNA-binding domain-containing protein [Erwinia tracheiphila]
MASLTVRTVQALIKAGEAGKFGDGRGLYLKVPPKGEAYWMLRYTIHSRDEKLLLVRYLSCPCPKHVVSLKIPEEKSPQGMILFLRENSIALSN